MLLVCGISNCDTVKKARAWLDAQGLAHHFHDFKRDGLDQALVHLWLEQLDWTDLINRRGTTWRRLDAAQQLAIQDRTSALQLMLTQPSVVKRPVVRWADGRWSLGFDPTAWAQQPATPAA